MDAQPVVKAQGQPTANGHVEKSRDAFTTSLGVIAATLGSAIGLGNIWKFPSLTGTNGGAAFIIIYLLSTLFVGLPVMIAELMMGRKAKANAVTTMQKLAPNRAPWWLIGAGGALAAFLIMAFYTEVAGWVFAYILKAASGSVLTTNPDQTGAAFTSLISDPLQSLIWQWIVLAVVGLIIALGVSKGIEAVTKRLMPILFGILIIVCIRSLTLPGAGEGLAFLFSPDFTKVTAATVLMAMGLSFFKLSVGMGTMITYGSYFRDDQNVPLTALRVMLADLSVSILAGIAIFPAVFAFGFKPDAGASLLFITIPAVFASMPFGGVFMVLFFVLAGIATIGAMLSLLEVPVAFLAERTHMTRKTATLLTVILLAVIGSAAALSNSVLANFKVFGLVPFDLFDFATSNILLPVGGFFICLFVGWVWGYDQVKQALSNEGQLHNERVIKLIFGLTKFVTPLLVFVVLLSQLKLI
jgi:NSS family neurotransmitter:Na+ symporter